MKTALHPETHQVTAHCACGYSFQTRSTLDDIRTTICSHCHPFYTGQQKFVDTAGRIEKFEQKYKKFSDKASTPKSEAKPSDKKKSADAKRK